MKNSVVDDFLGRDESQVDNVPMAVGKRVNEIDEEVDDDVPNVSR
jgi:hypothetical protein